MENKSLPMQVDNFSDLYDEDTDGNTKLILTAEERQKAADNVINPLNDLSSECLQLILSRQEEDATEKIVKRIETENNIYTTRDDRISEIWVYDGGIYKPNGESY